ncbi:MAG: ATP phosphoribosyltransferase regulatory subunit, partial [Hyphomicrobiales bacterium]|nr:ATP phosphoribosyltransferase regulatory subunit [Hyphomicrobiales bacterium]
MGLPSGGSNLAKGRSSDDAKLIDLFARRGFTRVEPPVLQPLEPFLELSGEDLRRR